MKYKSESRKSFRFHLIIGIVLFLINNLINAQNKQTAVWHVGNKCLDFKTTPVTVTNIEKSEFYGLSGTAIISDDNGELLMFVSSEGNIYNNSFQLIKNGDSIKIPSSYHRNIFIPIPCNDTLYYLFSINNCSIIDVENDTVIIKNNQWSSIGNFYRLFAVQHANCNDFWLIGINSEGLFSYLISSTGISDNYVFTPKQYSLDKGTISSSGNYYVLGGSTQEADTSIINFGTFNRNTGIFTNQIYYKYPDYKQCLAGAFSEDETKLYLYMFHKEIQYHILQINIINGIPDFDNLTILFTAKHSGPISHGHLQLGIDGKIYQTFFWHEKINIIHNPNIQGINCNYEDNAIQLTTNSSPPFFISTWFSDVCSSTGFCAENSCFSNPTEFFLVNASEVQSVLWDFGDNSTSTEINPSRTYEAPGSYTVTLTVTYTDNTTETLGKKITIYPTPGKPVIRY